MGRRQTDSKVCRSLLPVLFLLGMVSVCMALLWLPAVLKSTGNTAINQVLDLVENDSGGSGAEEIEEEVCCRGFEHLELWGDAVKWGAKHKMNSSRECCMACKGMCGSNGGPCLCNSWVFCGNRDACGPRFGEVWFICILFFIFLVNCFGIFGPNILCVFNCAVQGSVHAGFVLNLATCISCLRIELLVCIT